MRSPVEVPAIRHPVPGIHKKKIRPRPPEQKARKRSQPPDLPQDKFTLPLLLPLLLEIIPHIFQVCRKPQNIPDKDPVFVQPEEVVSLLKRKKFFPMDHWFGFT
jgi:hypothetical protein